MFLAREGIEPESKQNYIFKPKDDIEEQEILAILKLLYLWGAKHDPNDIYDDPEVPSQFTHQVEKLPEELRRYFFLKSQ
jgi:hypothetical protein